VLGRQDFDRHVAIQTGLVGFVDRSHTAGPNRFDDLILSERSTNEAHIDYFGMMSAQVIVQKNAPCIDQPAGGTKCKQLRAVKIFSYV
jgi:hypothetical protein